ncbi:MAG: UvrD-helicase domain-containing protein [Ignavibacteria bacterium]|nr:UvrD-helicase domain-containing protein [Ignavibacteria bacterium]
MLTSQQKDALDLSKHTLVTANAGSGKTFILTKRFLETIKQKKIKFNQIVAITFTEKAAAELLYRISNELDELLINQKNVLNPNEFSRLQEFREHILSAKISTIHSFCLDILKEFPVEAEIDPATEILDEINKRELIAKSVEETLIQNLDDEKVKDLLRILGKDNTTSFLSKLIEKRYFTDFLIQKLYDLNHEEIENFNLNFERYFSKIKEAAGDYFKSVFADKFYEAYELLSLIPKEITNKKSANDLVESINYIENQFNNFLKELDFEKIPSLFEAITQTLITKDLKVRKTHFKNADENSAITKFQKFVYEHRDFFSQTKWNKNAEKDKFNLILTIIKLYQQAKEKFHHLKILEGSLDFDDLLILTDKLLDKKEIREQLKNRYHFILVDEFQDTDTIQFNIIKKIAGDFESLNNVFVVGDEKQSIYGFRNAQLQVFQNFKYQLNTLNQKSKPSNIVSLNTSFRAAPSIAAFVNEIFSKIWKRLDFSSDKINYHQDVEYSPLQVGRDKFSDEAITLLVSNENEIQAEKIANYINYLINSNKKIFDRNAGDFRKIEYGDFALLFRTRAEMKEIENVFIEKKIPFVVSGGRGYFQSEEIQDWINYLNFLANPRNDEALLAILRSPFFAIDDNQILQISLQKGKSLFEKLKASIAQTNNELISYVYNILDFQLQAASRYTIPELIQTILTDTNYFGKIDYHPKKSQIIANIKKLINISHKFTAAGLRELKSFSQYLKEAFEKEETSEATLSEIKGSVQLMTIHQSKGLEFPIVILPNLEKELQSSTIKYGEITINDYFGFCFKLKDEEGDNYHTISSYFGNKINDEISYNEQLRILYVALTRATEMLVLSFYHFEDDKSNKEYSFKQILLNNLQPLNLSENNLSTLSTKLTFIEIDNNQPKEVEKNYTLKLEVIKDIVKGKNYFERKTELEKTSYQSLKILSQQISDKTKNEIFTATQLNVFAQCPLKFYLKFIIGYNPSKEYLFEKIDDDEVNRADLGLVFHELMKKLQKINLGEAEQTLNQIIENYPPSIGNKLKQNTLNIFNNLLSNETFIQILNHTNSLKEFELKIKFKNHILLGVIDRINISDDEITIIDFKTDSFPPNRLNEKINEYKVQMEFYVLLASEFFRTTNNIKLNLFFVNQPQIFSYSFNQNEINMIKEKFSRILEKIEQNIVEKNLDHCRICEFALKGKCIVN